MDRKRKVYAPFSQTSEAGVTQTPVEGYIDVSQMIYPTVSTGVVNEKGQWAGVKSDDDEFEILGTELAVPNGQEVLAPGGDTPFIDMTGFKDIQFAVKVSNTGNYAFKAVMGPDTNRFANLSPVNPAAELKGVKRNDHFHSLDKYDLIKFRSNIDIYNATNKNLKKREVLNCEKISRKNARRSIVTSQIIKKGERIFIDKIIMKRPGTGLSPDKLKSVLNKKAKRYLAEDTIIKKSDF